MLIRVAILIPRNYFTPVRATAGNGPTHRTIPLIQEALQRAGAEAELLEPGERPLSRPQALILPGGGDLHPGFYGQTPLQPAEHDLELDRFQLAWARKALREHLPLLGICRGLQVMNVAAGGSLHQDLPEHAPERVLDDPALRAEAVHHLETTPDSELRKLLGAHPGVNSIHHQAIDRLAAPFQVVATAADGTAEAIERRRGGFQLGVQFHPEDMPSQQGLFDRLVQAARS